MLGPDGNQSEDLDDEVTTVEEPGYALIPG